MSRSFVEAIRVVEFVVVELEVVEFEEDILRVLDHMIGKRIDGEDSIVELLDGEPRGVLAIAKGRAKAGEENAESVIGDAWQRVVAFHGAKSWHYTAARPATRG